MTTQSEFRKAYFSAMGWKTAVVADPNLSLHYPLCLYSFEGKKVLTLSEEFMEAAQDVNPEGTLDEALEALFDMEQVRIQKESVLGFFAALPVAGEALPPIPDDERLTELENSLSDADWLRGQVDPSDDFSACILENGRILAAAGAVTEGKIADVSVCVRPDCRKRGLGLRVVTSLLAKIRSAGKIAVYRVEESNPASVRLARSLGLEQGFRMEGALVTFGRDA